jgi:hypothetical protein
VVKNKAASLNPPVDWKVQKHGVFDEHYPAIVGVDIVGDYWRRSAKESPRFERRQGVRCIFLWRCNINTLTRQRKCFKASLSLNGVAFNNTSRPGLSLHKGNSSCWRSPEAFLVIATRSQPTSRMIKPQHFRQLCQRLKRAL